MNLSGRMPRSGFVINPPSFFCGSGAAEKKRRWVLLSWPLREGPIILRKKHLHGKKKDFSHFMSKETKEQSSQGLV